MRVDSHPCTFVWLSTACTSLLNSVYFHGYLFLMEVVAETSGIETLQRALFHKLKAVKAGSKGICQLYAWYPGGTVIQTQEEIKPTYKME